MSLLSHQFIQVHPHHRNTSLSIPMFSHLQIIGDFTYVWCSYSGTTKQESVYSVVRSSILFGRQEALAKVQMSPDLHETDWWPRPTSERTDMWWMPPECFTCQWWWLDKVLQYDKQRNDIEIHRICTSKSWCWRKMKKHHPSLIKAGQLFFLSRQVQVWCFRRWTGSRHRSLWGPKK